MSLFGTSENKQLKVSEKQILEGLKNRDDKIFTYISDKYYPVIKSLVLSFKGLVMDPEDIYIEGLMKACLNVEKGIFKGNSSFYTYLYAICKNMCLKLIVQQGRNSFVSIEYFEAPDEPASNVEEQIIMMMTIMKQMDQKCKEIINLRFGLGFETHYSSKKNVDFGSNFRFDVISDILGIEPENARKRFNRCLKKLKILLENNESWKLTLINN